MVPKSVVGMVWEGQKCSMKRGLGVSHGSQEWGGKGLLFLMVPKSGVGRAWEAKHEA